MQYGAINIDPETMSGTPVFTGTRVPITFLFDYLEDSTVNEFLENFPTVHREQVLEVLSSASTLLSKETILHENFT
jgi:uncharacterized protein (DUF433 family)